MGSPDRQLPTGPDALAEFDCIMLGDVAPEQLPLADRARLERYVADRGGTLLILAGKRSMPLAYPDAEAGGEADPLRKLLPVEGARVEARPEGFPLTLTREGEETDFLRLDPDASQSARRWAELPPHYWAVVGRAKPGATPLAYLSGSGSDRGKDVGLERQRALIVRQNYGFGRVLFVGLDSTWRWRYKVGDTYHHRFWGQAVRWAAADRPLVTGNEFVRFGTPQPVYHQGQEVELILRLTEALGPVKPDLLAGAQVLRRDGPGGKEEAVALVPLAKRETQPRVLEGHVRDLPVGQYEVEMVIPDLADKLRSGPALDSQPLRATFTVAPADGTEMSDLGTNGPLLDELAAKSGGRVFTPEDARELVDRLVGQSVAHTDYHEQRLWQGWGVLALVLTLLTLEWAGRKWAGLP